MRALFGIGLVWTVLAEAALMAPSVWPMPKEVTLGSSSVSVSPQLAFRGGNDAKTLASAYDRYAQLMFPHPGAVPVGDGPGGPTVLAVDVAVEDLGEAYPQLETDESYELRVDIDGSASISARTVYGVLRGLETLSQLVVYDFDSSLYVVAGCPVSISDAPRYAHRGILMDTARHFQPIRALERLIDAMSYAKLNVFHWHVVDTESFPFESKTYPDLWTGSFTKQERYEQEEIIALVEYARLRGIKVMIEFDMPGHAQSWCAGYPAVCPSPQCQQPLNPASDATFPLIEALLGECTGFASRQGMFPYDLIHLGADEVSYTCWQVSAEIQAWEEQMGFSGSEDTYKYFVDKTATIARDQGRLPVQWVEVFEHFGSALSNDTIVHVWKDKSTLDSVVNAGYRALLSDNDLWYLDHLSITWDEMYENEPTSVMTNIETTGPLLLGGEGCMWGETVDSSDLESTVWPRAAAIAERLWTPQDRMDVEAAVDRIETFRCLLTQRGVAAAPVLNSRARNAPPKQGSCYAQRRA